MSRIYSEKWSQFKHLRILLGVILLSILLVQLNYGLKIEGPGQRDLLEYWAAAKLIKQGENPYDSEKIAAIQAAEESIGKSLDAPILMWNPPTVIPLIAFLGDYDFLSSRLIWTWLTTLSILIFLGGTFWLLKPKISLQLLLALLTFFPIISVLQFGQISWVFCLGLILALIAHRYQRSVISGALLSLGLIKPHLMYLTYLSLFLLLDQKNKKNFLIGFVAGALTLASIAEILAPGVWNQWIIAFKSPPSYFKTPTLGGALLSLFGVQNSWVIYVPAAITLSIGIICFNKPWTKDILKDPIGITALSLATAPYGWIFDHSLLLPAIVKLISSPTKSIALSVLICNLLGFVPWFPAQHHYWWYPPAIFALIAIDLAISKRALNKSSSDVVA